jgi:hypothetical protein
MRYSLEGLKDRFELAEERTNEYGDRLMEITQNNYQEKLGEK